MRLFMIASTVLSLLVSVTKCDNQTIHTCTAITGMTKGKPCHFPFTYNGATISRCTRQGSTYYWCATEPSYHGNNYGECSSNCLVENEITTNKDATHFSSLDTNQSCVDEWNKCNSFSIPEYGCHDSEVRKNCKKSCSACEAETTSDPNPTHCTTI